MKTKCPACAETIEADDQMAGMKVPCPTCQQEFTLPNEGLPPRLPGSSIPIMTSPPPLPKSALSVQPPPLPQSALNTQPGSSAQLPPSHPSGQSSGFLKTVQIGVVCITAIIGLWIWKGSSQTLKTVTANDGNTYKVNVSAMKAVMKQDSELSAAKKAALDPIKPKQDEDLDRIAAIMRDYVSACKRVDMSSCPRDFAEAYYRHFTAWAEEADVIANHPHIPVGSEAFVEGFFRGLAGDITGGAVERQDQFNAWGRRAIDAAANVNRTWNEVEALAVRYDAR